MRTCDGKISSPIAEMMKSERYGRVVFIVSDFQQKFNTRTAALGNRSRHGYDIYTQSTNPNELHVIRRGYEDRPEMVVDLT